MRPRGLWRRGAEVASRYPAPDGCGCAMHWPLHLLRFGPLRVFMFAAPVSAMPALAEWSIRPVGI